MIRPNMLEKSLRVLEFVKIRDRLAALAITSLGAQACQALIPHNTLADAEHAQEETQEALTLLTYRGEHPLSAFEDVRPSLKLAQKGSVLSPRALLDIANCLRCASSARTALTNERDDSPILNAMSSALTSNFHLERGIKDAIISEEEIADNASSELASIRRQMRLTNDRIKDRLRTMTQSATISKYLQEPIVTMRNGRYVLPVRQEYRQHVPGLMHDQSSSGATVFVEPMAVVEMGNELKGWMLREDQEIERILSAFSAQVAMQADAIGANVEVLTRLDFIFAKGQLAKEMRAIAPKMNQKGYIRFVRVRHPLLDPSTVVPCDLWLGDEFSSLIITGPNTGGKTVTLKTIGLMALMAQAGLHLPGDLGTEVSVFDHVYADIGDEQSIEQSLSTFSSHMTNIVVILEEVQERDLVLFDELGAGTDPTEGAALAQAILDTLRRRGIRTVATTHYSELKAYALSTKGVENASVEFDVSTLSPTYRLSIGVPGKSNAFDISRRLGLSEQIINASKARLSTETLQFEDVIANAEYHRQVAQKERVLAQEAHAQTVALRKEAEALYQKLEAGRQNAEKKAKEDARKIVERAKRESAALMEELKMLKRGGGDIAAGMGAVQRRIQDLEGELSEGLSGSRQAFQTKPEDIMPGDTVDVPHLNAVASVITKPDAKGDMMIQAGIIKVKVNVQQVRKAAKKNPRPSRVKVGTQGASRDVKMSCDVRGLMLDEALMEVDRYLDMAVLSGLGEVSIIHGKGTGALRNGIQRHLKNAPQVTLVRTGQYGEGDAGVTVVELR